MRRPGCGTTRCPKASCRTTPGADRWTTTRGGCGIAESAAAASGATVSTSRAASRAGTARQSWSTSTSSAGNEIFQPCPDRRSDSTRAPKRTRVPSPSASRRGRVSSPERKERRPGFPVRGAFGLPRNAANAPRVRLPPSTSQRAREGKACSTERRSDRPPQIPDTKGSTSRSATSGPTRLVKKARTVSPDGSPFGTNGSASRRSFPESERSLVRMSSRGDIGSGCSRPPKSMYRGVRGSARSVSDSRPSSSTSAQSSVVGRTVFGPSSSR